VCLGGDAPKKAIFLTVFQGLGVIYLNSQELHFPSGDPMKKMVSIISLLAVVALSVPAFAQDAEPAPAAPTAVDCKTITDKAARKKCRADKRAARKAARKAKKADK
jgi:hypothetical protein